jgi:hypothetical protein
LDTVTGEPGSETIVPPSGTPVACLEPPTQLQDITEREVWVASVCGEAASEGPEGKSLVLTIAKNRANKTGGNASTVIPPGVQATPLVRELLKIKAFSCWNDQFPSPNAAVREAAGSNPRSSRANFEKRMNYLLSRCGSGDPIAGVSVTVGRKALQDYGMTKEESERTYLYLNPATASKKAGNWAEDTIKSANAHPNDTYWTGNIRDSGGRVQKATLVRIGRHVFVSSPGLNP